MLYSLDSVEPYLDGVMFVWRITRLDIPEYVSEDLDCL